MEQTAVEWIEGYLKKFNHIQESLSLRKAFEKAKAMEKEQVIDAHNNGRGVYPVTIFVNDAEQYYNETFKNEKK